MRAQHSTATLVNRYPNIFGALRRTFAERHGPDLGGEAVRILSFGCSTGAEVLSVRAYFPDAEILGCDINPAALSASAEALEADFAVTFLSDPKTIRALGPYDIVLANAVLCSYPQSARNADLTGIFPFSQFCDLIGPLLESLKPGGVFALTNANYFFRDAPGAEAFEPLAAPQIEGNGFVEKFGRDSRRIASTPVFLGQRHYASRIERADHPYTDDDFRHCAFVKGKAPVRRDAEPEAPAAARLVLGGDPAHYARDGLTGAGLYRGEAGAAIVYEWRKALLNGAVAGLGRWAVRGGGGAAREALVLSHRWTRRPIPKRRNWLTVLRARFGG
jgi:SAM-dependent methyltransferase